MRATIISPGRLFVGWRLFHVSFVAALVVAGAALLTTSPGLAEEALKARCTYGSDSNQDSEQLRKIQACTDYIKSLERQPRPRNAYQAETYFENLAYAYDARGRAHTFRMRIESISAAEKETTARQALADFDQAIKRHPKRLSFDNSDKLPRAAVSQFYVHRGYVWEAKEDFDRAIKEYDAATRTDPTNEYAYQNRASIWEKRGDFDRAIAEYDRYIEIKKPLSDATVYAFNMYTAYRNRARLWEKKGDFGRALADLDAGVNVDSEDEYPYEARGDFLIRRGDLNRAMADYDHLVRKHSDLFSGYHGRARILAKQGDFDGAIAEVTRYIDRSIDQDSSSYFPLEVRGDIRRLKGDFERAIADYDAAIRLDRDQYGRAFFRRGRALLETGQLRPAIADLDKAVANRSNTSEERTTRGLAYELNGEKQKAQSDYEAAARSTYLPDDEEEQKARQRAGERLAALAAADYKPPAVTKPAPPKPAPVAAIPATSAAQPATEPTKEPAAAARPFDPGRRVALVIGNSAYSTVPALPNPKRDADAIAAMLRRTGFQSVTLHTDLTRDKLLGALNAFAREAEKADWAVVYFAGHGIEVGGVNYLIPTEAKLEADRDVRFQAVALDDVLTSVESAKKLRLVILDACRDNPFASQMRRTIATRSIGRGLNRVEPGGVLVAYAAKHGEVALDGVSGSDANSPFVSALLKHLPTPGVEIGKLFRLVRDEVLKVTEQKQEPFVYGSLPGEDFFFVAGR